MRRGPPRSSCRRLLAAASRQSGRELERMPAAGWDEPSPAAAVAVVGVVSVLASADHADRRGVLAHGSMLDRRQISYNDSLDITDWLK